MNATSSRSHAIFTITIERSEKGLDGQQHLRMGKLHMVDLAVSVPNMFHNCASLSHYVLNVLLYSPLLFVLGFSFYFLVCYATFHKQKPE